MRKDIEELIKRNKIKTLGFKKSYNGLEKILENDEKVIYICNTNFKINNIDKLKVNVFKIKDKNPTVFAITNKRLIFYFKVLLNEECIQVPINELREYDFKRDGITGGVLRIITLTKIFDLDLIYKKETMETIIKALEEAKQITKYPNSSFENDNISKIERLSKLKNEGIISEQDFENKKSELLNKI